MARSKKSSGAPDLPAVFTDRCLGDRMVPERLRAAGFEVQTMAEVYGQETGQELEDPVWIKEMTEQGLVIFSKDAKIKSVHKTHVIGSGASCFLLPEQGLPAREMSARYIDAKGRIAARAQKRGPYVYMVGREGRLTKVELPSKYPSKADRADSPARIAAAV